MSAAPSCAGIEMPAASGIGQVRAIARAYGAFAAGGKELGLSAATRAALRAPARREKALRDAVHACLR